jgi:hypothetical protein
MQTDTKYINNALKWINGMSLFYQKSSQNKNEHSANTAKG